MSTGGVATADRTEAATPTLRRRLRSLRFWVVVAVVLVLVLVGGRIVTGLGDLRSPFDPEGTGPTGAGALRAVLEQQGVEVAVARRLAEVPATVDGTLLVDASTVPLTETTWRSLLGRASRVVVVGADLTALEVLLPGTREAGRPSSTAAAARCDANVAARAGSMALADVTHSLRSTSGTVCFADRRGAGQVVTGRTDGVQIVLLADRVAFDDQHITARGNAAVALTALGGSARLTWYVPGVADAGGVAPTLQSLTPPWVTPVVVLLLLAGLATAIHRGRRLGAVVVESLPVVVRSRETVEGRARLYEQGRSRLRAADALRIGAIGRIAPLVGLGRGAAVEDVVVAASRLTGRSRDGITDLLLTAEPATDRDLVRISDDLARLETAVRAATVPGAAVPDPPAAPTNGAP